MTQSSTLRKEAAAAKAFERTIVPCVREGDDRLLAFMCVAPGKESHVSPTLLMLLKQCEETGVSVVCIVGLNNGAECAGVPGIVVQQLFGGERVNGSVAPYRDEKGQSLAHILDVPTKENVVVFLHQHAGAECEGRHAIMKDVFDAVHEAMIRGWKAPEYTLQFDDDLRLMAAPSPGKVPDTRSNGLAILLDECRRGGFDMLGCRSMRCAYRVDANGDMQPAFDVPMGIVFDVQNERNAMWRSWICGVGIIARTSVLMALMSRAKKHIWLKNDDLFYALVAPVAGWSVFVSKRCISTNRAPGGGEEDAQKMALRTLASNNDAVYRHFGIDNNSAFRRCARLLSNLVAIWKIWRMRVRTGNATDGYVTMVRHFLRESRV